MKRFLFSLLSTVLVTVPAAHASTVLTFDDLPMTQPYYGSVPNGYGGLQWEYFGFLDPKRYPVDPGGYLSGMVSEPYVAFNAYAHADGRTTGSIYLTGGTFDFESAEVTSAWNYALTLDVLGYRQGSLAYSNSYTLGNSAPSLLEFNYNGVDRVDVISRPVPWISLGTQAAFDNIKVTVPEPGCLPLLLVGAFLARVARRRGSSCTERNARSRTVRCSHALTDAPTPAKRHTAW